METIKKTRFDGKAVFISIDEERNPKPEAEKPDYVSKFVRTAEDCDMDRLFTGEGTPFNEKPFAVVNDPINWSDIFGESSAEAWWDLYQKTHGVAEKNRLVLINPYVRFWDSVAEDAVRRIGPENFTVLLGRAGTGKTTLIRHILEGKPGGIAPEILSQLPARLKVDEVYNSALRVFPCSPTGVGCENLKKALKPLGEGLFKRVMTPHSRFKMVDRNGGQEGEPLWWDSYTPPVKKGNPIYILNEALFVDSRTFALFLMCIPEGAHVILEGDPLQLPPVGKGEPVRGLISSGMMKNVITLTKVHRVFSESSGLAEAASQILDGKAWPKGGRGFETIITEGFSHMSDTVLRLMEHGYQVVTPTNGLAVWFGSRNAENRYRDSGNEGRKVDSDGMYLRRGDLCRLLTSHRSRGAYNGQIVMYWGYSPHWGRHDVLIADKNGMFNRACKILHVKIPEEVRRKIQERKNAAPRLLQDGLTEADFEQFFDNTQQDSCAGLLMHAESVTVHRAQGSEWDNVAVVMPWPVRPLTLEWLYVAISRARKNCKVILMQDAENPALIDVVRGKSLRPCERCPSKIFEI